MRPLRMFLQIFVGIPAMTGLYLLVRWVVKTNIDFGCGLFVGLMLMLGLMLLVKKIDPESYYGKKDWERINGRDY